MKRAGNLIEAIADPDNLRLAFWKARKGKEGREDAERFRLRLDENLLALRGELLTGEVSVGDYRYFTIYEPKERRICASAFRERVLHHAVINICHPIFERFQIGDSYATRKGKGQYASLDKAKTSTRRYRWFCKMDVRKYFDSIDHGILYEKLSSRFKDPRLLNIFFRIIDSYHSAPDKGLPIGNLTSQYCANFYLGFADHFVKEQLRVKAYVRYMDDMMMWDDDKKRLLDNARRLEEFLLNHLQLHIKPSCINSCDKGVPFLGYVLLPETVRLHKNSKKRFIRKIKKYAALLGEGVWSQEEYALHIQPLFAFTRHAQTFSLRSKLLSDSGIGL